jgi:hypothetical protein
VSLIAVADHCRAHSPAVRSPVCFRFEASRQRAEQNRACSRRGANEVPHYSQFRRSAVIILLPAYAPARPVGQCIAVEPIDFTVIGPGKHRVKCSALAVAADAATPQDVNLLEEAERRGGPGRDLGSITV